MRTNHARGVWWGFWIVVVAFACAHLGWIDKRTALSVFVLVMSMLILRPSRTL